MTTHTLTHTFLFPRLVSLKLPRVNWRMCLFFGLCSILFFSVFYVFQVQIMIRGGYLIKNYQKKIETLSQENKNLEINLAQMSYMENIQKKTQELKFEKVQKIKYIQILDSSLAKK